MFSDLSAGYNFKPWQIRFVRQITEELAAHKAWVGADWVDESEPEKDVRLLDYACGTGAITTALGPFVTTIRGIDVSDGMVEKFNATAKEAGLTPKQVNAVVGNLFTPAGVDKLQDPDLFNFDVAVTSFGMHHFDDPALAVYRLGDRLKPGKGVLVVIDFLPFETEEEKKANSNVCEHSHSIKHDGFNKDNLGQIYKDAGFSDFSFEVLEKPAAFEQGDRIIERTMFMARGTKNATST